MHKQADKERMAAILGIGLAVALIVFAMVMKYSNNPVSINNYYENSIEKNKTLAQIRINLLQAEDMEKNAVMAHTDLESLQFANQSRSASALVEEQRMKLAALIEAIPMDDERKLMDEFSRCWKEFGALDQVILQLAVENTNLKAASLSREKGAEAMLRFEQAIHDFFTPSLAPDDRQVASLAHQALIAALKLYNLHAVHIAEESDEAMDRFEQRMQSEAREVSQRLDALEAATGAAGRETVLRAKTAFADFTAVTDQVVALSRKNSNIKSLQLSLGRKRNVAAQCDEILAKLQERHQHRKLKATK